MPDVDAMGCRRVDNSVGEWKVPDVEAMGDDDDVCLPWSVIEVEVATRVAVGTVLRAEDRVLYLLASELVLEDSLVMVAAGPGGRDWPVVDVVWDDSV